MKNLLMNLALFGALLFPPALMAQDTETGDPKKTPEQRAADRTEKMATELDLSSDQKARVQEINLRYAQAAADAKAQSTSKDAMRKRGKELKEKRDEELKGVLTPDQFAKMTTLRKQKHQEAKAYKKEGQQPNGAKPHNE